MPSSEAVKDSAWLVRFDYQGGPTTYTDWTSDLTYEGEIYLSEPAMDIEFTANSGALNEGKTRIELPVDAFTAWISDGEEKPPIEVSLIERRFNEGGEDDWIHYIGDVHQATQNPKGRPNIVRLTAKTVKSRMESPLGIEADNFCKNTFGMKGCFFDLEAQVQTFIVQEIDGLQVTVTASVLQLTNDWWARGSMQLDGIRIMVRDWNQLISPTVYYLAREAPPDWVGRVVELRPGCKKQVINCRERDNEEHFLGLGIGMPSYNPNLENPG